ncbi:MAG: phosphoglucomutase [Flavobacteriaceae bacterium]|nr:phosphoglucomutase [Flavobacteriaceae bacterium]
MNIIQKSKIWEKSPFDSKTRNKVRELKKNPDLLYDSFYKNLEFGTGGIRGIMGVGTNRVNKYTIGKTTQGLAKYLLKSFKNDNIKVVLAYDCRNNGVLYSKVVSNVLSANGIICYVFRDIRPTPQLSFAIKELNAQCGIMLTASHNPPEYNGYKVYWSDGGQIVPPIDKNLIEIINSTKYEEINFKSEKKYITKISKNFDNKFIEASTKSVKFKVLNQENLKITFSSLHGTSIKILPDLMKKEGFKNFNIVDIESQPDGNFGKLTSPNPEDPKSFKESLKLANKTDSDIVIVTDPDADRLGIAIRNNNKKLVLLNGNQTMVIFTDFLLNQLRLKKKLNKNYFVATTIVSTPLMSKIAENYGVDCKITLTGFKWISKLISENKNIKFIGGGEESYGYLVGDLIRDKDAITSSLLACKIAAYLKNQNKSIFDYLISIYKKYGLYKEKLISIEKKGKKGNEEINNLMNFYRKYKSEYLGKYQILVKEDYESGFSINLKSTKKNKLNLPRTNLLRFIFNDGSILSIRPSGTEPKIKLYISVNMSIKFDEKIEKIETNLNNKIDNLIRSLKI